MGAVEVRFSCKETITNELFRRTVERLACLVEKDSNESEPVSLPAEVGHARADDHNDSTDEAAS